MLDWIGENGQKDSSSSRKFLIIFMPTSAIVLLLAWIAGIFSYSPFVFIFLCNLIYVAAGLKRTNDIHKALSRKYNFLSSMNGMLKAFENEPFVSAILNEIKLNLTGKEISASGAVKKLGRLIQAFDSRNNMMVAFVLNGLFLWDYLSISRLEKWKSEYTDLFPLWLDMVGQADAYISLGNYAFNNPAFIYPVKSADQEMFSAKDLGHQLIDESKRVCNNFSLGKKGTVCIISGANMAGKSTFLRTIAVNYILGMIGAPVCASEMKFIPAKIFTSMRTVDSLSDNESYFYAELRRLSILKARIEIGEPLFFILDEILKGTNSEDKSTGSKLFLERIIEKRGTGLIATHDTSLAKLELSHTEVINKCFEIEIDGENIKFDYKIQNGITQKMNAVLLMRQMGILD
jgi:DNA mismatch repair ATPase MutS